MQKLSINCCFLAAFLTLGTLTTSLKANAALIPYNLGVDIDSGPLTGNVYTGKFIYDNTGLSGIGAESVPLTSLNFNFEGNPYTEDDDPDATVSFLDGIFLVLDFAVDSPPAPTFTSGTIDASDALFSYNLGGAGLGGTGTVTFAIIPEPSSWFAFAIPLAYLARKRKKQ